MGFTPETSSVIFRRDLTQTAREFDETAAAALFKGGMMAPSFTVAEDTARYPVWTRENFKKRPGANTRREGGGYQRIDSTFNQLTYATEEHGLEHKLDDRRGRRYRTFLDFEQHAAAVLRYQQLQEYEIRVKTLFETTMGLTNTNVSVAWTTVATGVPVTDIHTAAKKITQKTGVPRSQLDLFIPETDFDELMATTQVIDLVKYTFARDSGIRPQNLREADVAHMMGIRSVNKLSSYYDSADEGQSETNSAIWTAGVMYLGLFAEPGASLETMSAARTMIWDQDGGGDIPIMERYRDESIRSDILRAREDTDEVQTGETDLFVQKITNT